MRNDTWSISEKSFDLFWMQLAMHQQNARKGSTNREVNWYWNWEEVMVQFFSANTIVRKHINPHPLFSWKSGSWLTEKYWFQMNLYQQQRHYVGWQAAKKNRLQLILIVHKKYLESKNVRYLVTVKLNDGTFIHLISEFSQIICS